MPRPPWHPKERQRLKRLARLHRLQRAGLAPSISKTELRALADHAAATHKITKLPPQRIITEPHE